jgi:hypothetical protein
MLRLRCVEMIAELTFLGITQPSTVLSTGEDSGFENAILRGQLPCEGWMEEKRGCQ